MRPELIGIVRNVFNDGAELVNRERSCILHFQKDVQFTSDKLQLSSRKDFKILANKWRSSQTDFEYSSNEKKLNKFITVCCSADQKRLQHWMNWWKARKYHIFSCYAPMTYFQTDMSEVVHAGDQSQNPKAVPIITAIFHDAKKALEQQVLFALHKNGQYKGSYDFRFFLQKSTLLSILLTVIFQGGGSSTFKRLQE